MWFRNLSLIPTLTNKCLFSGSHSNNVPAAAGSLISYLKTHNISSRSLTTISLNQSLELITNSSKPIKLNGNGPFQLNINEERPLTVILAWLMSERKHIHKFAKFYLDNGFDVLTVKTTPWQLLWPVTGSHVGSQWHQKYKERIKQSVKVCLLEILSFTIFNTELYNVVANDLLSFLYQNPNYYKTVVHGFSVGGYVWGEVMVKMNNDIAKYTPTINRISGQIWDSIVDYAQIPIGFPPSVFPTNAFLRKCLQRYVIFHMKTYQDAATKHYLKAADLYYNSIVGAPAMFLYSLSDPMVNLKTIESVRDLWQKNGTPVNLRAWQGPPHVGIFKRHPEEYQHEIRQFIEKHVFPHCNKDKFELKTASSTVH